MMVRPVQGTPETMIASRAEKTTDERAVAKAAQEMEGVFVRHLLAAAKMGGSSSDSGYGSMAVDALAQGIQGGGGLGLARAIEEALAPPRHPPPPEPVEPKGSDG